MSKKPDLSDYEHRPGDPETLGDDKGHLDGEVPAKAIAESEKARHPRLRTADGRVKEGHETADPTDPYGEERVSDEPHFPDADATAKSERASPP